MDTERDRQLQDEERQRSVAAAKAAIDKVVGAGVAASAALVRLERAQPDSVLLSIDTAELRAAFEHYHAAQKERRLAAEKARWPQCAPGPCAAGPEGLVLPESVSSRALANEVLSQLVSTRGLRELTSREKDAFRALRRQGIAQPSAPHEFTAIAKNRLRQLSKAAKRARNAQRTMEGARKAAQLVALDLDIDKSSDVAAVMLFDAPAADMPAAEVSA